MQEKEPVYAGRCAGSFSALVFKNAPPPLGVLENIEEYRGKAGITGTPYKCWG
jgi:hypothetical protein